LRFQLRYRSTEGQALLLAAGLAAAGFFSAAAARQVRLGEDPAAVFPGALTIPAVLAVVLLVFHLLLNLRGLQTEQIVWPAVSLIFVIGLVMIYRLRGVDGAMQQLLRGYIPGVMLAALFIVRPQLIETLRRFALPIGIFGLLLPFATALFGVVDETGARLALKLGPLPAVQTTELIKLSLIIYLAWHVEQQGQAAEGRARIFLGLLRIPALPYFIPGVLFVAVATLALTLMSDYGAVLILGAIFIAILYAGFETRTFLSVAAIGLILAVLVGLVLSFTWTVPAVIQLRFLAFLNPWSTQEVVINGVPLGINISQGPGYQIQQSVYAIIAGGLSGRGIGFGSPYYIPLAHSDFIFAAILEEFGSLIGVALLFLFGVLFMRLVRIVFLLPEGQVFERLLLVGIAAHLFAQVFVMVAGTLNIIPLTGITIPFLSQGGMALMVNLTQVGIALALCFRMEAKAA
jgi:cell division protein FtsW (lipid II flippase)